MLRIQFVTLPRLKLPFLLQPQSVILGRKKKFVLMDPPTTAVQYRFL